MSKLDNTTAQVDILRYCSRKLVVWTIFIFINSASVVNSWDNLKMIC